MFQLLFGLGVDNAKPGVMVDLFRNLFAVFDSVVYTCIGIIYNILFNIADSNIISSDLIKTFYSRVQLILGVIMIFKISISLMQYVINPDAFSDKKTGLGQVISRIVIMLAMLTAIMPLNIPESAAPENSYNSYLNQHGLLFGTLYSLQHRILSGNTIAKLVLGSTNNSFISQSSDGEDSTDGFSTDSNAGNVMASYILKNFITINYNEIPEDEDANDSILVCKKDAGIVEGQLSKLKEIVVKGTTIYAFPPFAIAYKIYEAVKNDEDDISKAAYYYKAWGATDSPSVVSSLVDIQCSDGYAFAYFPIVSTICGVILLITLGVSCLDVAIRALKLAILRLVAPIAILSYIDPKSSEKGAFGNWVKMLISTYIDLFLRLAIIYFVVFLVDSIVHGGLDLPVSKGIIGCLSTVVIIIGLFYFARQAPKFITDALGIKSAGMGIGISGLLGAAGSFMGGGGLAGAAAGFIGASNDTANAAAQGKQAPPAYANQRAKMAQIITGDDKNDGSMAYRMQKGLQNAAGSRRINSLYGINKNSLAAAKQKMYDTANDATRAKNAYDNFQSQYDNFMNGSKADVAKALGFDYDEQSGYMMDQDGNLIDDDKFLDAKNQRADEMLSTRSRLEEAYIDAEATAGKAKSDYEKMQKIGDRANISMTPEQEHRGSIAERYKAIHALSQGIYQGRQSGVWNGVKAGADQLITDIGSDVHARDHQTLKQKINGNNKFK